MAVTQKLACRVDEIVSHGDHVYTVMLRPQRSVPRFRPGQFLHLALDRYDPSGFWPESRVFSISSSPSRRDQLRVSYSVQGRFTAKMEAELSKDREVWVKLPYGNFVIDSSADVVLLAGGTGITAFTAFLEDLTPETRQSVTLAYGARTRALLIYRDLVTRCARTVSTVDVAYFVEQAEVFASGSESREHSGRLSVEAVWPNIPRPKQAAYYISGPPAMLKTLSHDLRAHGIAQKAINIDAWE